ncbi:MAG: Stp1/IreP family PP2C-type Ser/Thr phosphatase [Myxococcales bacterium]|nr:MAG: Stp1/IreP family PP2C-type Ser/Thr phosphatase [Myxococcales bacterium]
MNNPYIISKREASYVKSHARVLVTGDTNVGIKRNHNEDNYAILEEDNLYIVADGMGGHACGEVASKLAIATLRDFFKATSADPEATWPYKMDRSRGYEENRLITGIKLANLRIFESQQKDSKLRGMGTTLVAISVGESGVYVGHVGDSRVYRLRDGYLEQLTEDHSLLNDYIKMRKLSEEEIKNFPHKNVIVRALGMKENVRVDTILDQPRAGDLYILCSDGLSGPVTDEEIKDIAINNPDLKKLTQALIDRANEHGGPDNVTVVAARWLGSG